MNKVILSGRFVRDPEVRYGQGDNPTAFARYTLAVDRRFKREGQPTADFINCRSIGKTAEFVEKYMKQGTKVVAEGRIETGSYQDKENKTVYYTEVVVENLEFAEGKKTDGSQNQTEAQSAVEPAAQQAAPAAAENDGFVDIPMDDAQLPFNF